MTTARNEEVAIIKLLELLMRTQPAAGALVSGTHHETISAVEDTIRQDGVLEPEHWHSSATLFRDLISLCGGSENEAVAAILTEEGFDMVNRTAPWELTELDMEKRWYLIHFSDSPYCIKEKTMKKGEMGGGFPVSHLRTFLAEADIPVPSDQYLEIMARACIRLRMMQPNRKYGIPMHSIVTYIVQKGMA